MDLLTQLDSDLDLLLRIMSSSIAYISRKAKHTPLPSSTVPLTILGKTESIEPAEMDEAINELVTDLVEKAASIREIILHLPTRESLGTDDELQNALTGLQREMDTANQEYISAVSAAKVLQKEVSELVQLVAEQQRQGRSWLVKELEQPTESVAKQAEG